MKKKISKRASLKQQIEKRRPVEPTRIRFLLELVDPEDVGTVRVVLDDDVFTNDADAADAADGRCRVALERAFERLLEGSVDLIFSFGTFRA